MQKDKKSLENNQETNIDSFEIISTSDNNFNVCETITWDLISPTRAEWLIENLIPLGEITIIAGDGGVGKSTLACYITAMITTGNAFYDCVPVKQGEVLYFSTEDDPSKILKQRFNAHEADLNKIHFLKEELIEQIKEPQKIIETLKVKKIKAVIIDPLIDLFEGDTYKNSDIANFLNSLAFIAKEANVSIIGLHHFIKDPKVKQLNQKLAGSHQFVAKARAVIAVIQEKDGKYFGLVKSNYSILDHYYEFNIDSTNVVYENIDKPFETSKLNVIGKSECYSLQNLVDKVEKPTFNAIKHMKSTLTLENWIREHGGMIEISVAKKELIGKFFKSDYSLHNAKRKSEKINHKKISDKNYWILNEQPKQIIFHQ
ncbi:AAA family ATPase [Taylorella equigenitalis]|uniref:AAA family ATPase n=1 Tax=Taylorella equigenitalis TaxID=29575 RepID=UPI00237C86AD|nr:AAA family ATPase [Taylorella equigenitalis]WDU48752.1 AAA family ATPase [Taylorella equigenitalis]WDU51227.1 AAA family ATPase [Taylorella equigenitalis]